MFKHLKETKMNYWIHWLDAIKMSGALFIHAWYPDVFKTYVSDKLKKRKVMGCKCKSCKCKEMTNEQVIQQMEDQTKPFTEEKYSDNTVLRHFDPTAPDHLYKWHADEEHRYIEALNENDWEFQFDNELPQSLEPGKIIHIPKGLIHRLIKGKSELSISIKS